MRNNTFLHLVAIGKHNVKFQSSITNQFFKSIIILDLPFKQLTSIGPNILAL